MSDDPSPDGPSPEDSPVDTGPDGASETGGGTGGEGAAVGEEPVAVAGSNPPGEAGTDGETNADRDPSPSTLAILRGRDPPGPDEASPRARMAWALRAVRLEVWKAAIVRAIVDAAVVFLAVNLLVTVADPGLLPTPAVVAVPVGLAAFAVDLRLRVRRPLVERFEAVNPGVAEALRTARDAVDAGADSRMAARLYDDVLERLTTTSGVALLDRRRLAGGLVVVIALSLASIQVAVVGFSLFGGPAPTPTDGPTDPAAFTGLRDGNAVLGNPEAVTAGDENLTAQIETTAGDGPVASSEQFPTSRSGPNDADATLESQHAGFLRPEQLEEAELIREYTVRIRDDD